MPTSIRTPHRRWTSPFAALRRTAFLIAAASLAAAAATPLAHAAWPERTVRLVVPYGPGGSSDVIARLLANEMSKTLGQAVIVDNKAGASGIIAMQEVARAAPDGYNIVLGHVGTLAVNPAMFAKLPYGDEDFAPVALLAKVPMVFAVGAKVPAQTLAEFVALAKAQPDKLNYGSAGNGSAGHLAFNATTTIAPWGGSDARLGNSPVGFGVPNPGGRPFLLDMAISVAARAKIRNALKRGDAIPDTWATDKAGRTTTDPAAALEGFLLPIGGHKGYGLALLVDLFAGLLSGAAYLTHVKSWVDAPDEPQNLGHFFILIDTRHLGSTAWLAQRMNDFAAILHGSPPAEASRPVLVPGEIELDNLARHRRDGLALDPAVLALLEEHAAKP